eukprot:GHVO01070508.1.p1 GENE.GHVO01070508.1~~GHVO01070508.1.p1  ORF type:complete len:126 (+),score=31.78 GHVO01070508.1:30-407(+)
MAKITTKRRRRIYPFVAVLLLVSMFLVITLLPSNGTAEESIFSRQGARFLQHKVQDIPRQLQEKVKSLEMSNGSKREMLNIGGEDVVFVAPKRRKSKDSLLQEAAVNIAQERVVFEDGEAPYEGG